jgi:lysozyme
MNGEIDWTEVAKSGYAFVFIKATEGKSLIDPAFKRNWDGAGAAGLLRSVYHFYRIGTGPDVQADLFLSQAVFSPGDLPPLLDLEEVPGGASTTTPNLVFDMATWLARIAAASGRQPIVYTPRGFAAKYYSELTSLNRFPVFIPDYARGAAAPRVPSSWDVWTFWQSRDDARVPGVRMTVNLDYFNGSVTDLRAFAGITAK